MDLLKAGTLAEALDFLERHPDARILAGGTDLIIHLRKTKERPAAILDISSVGELAGIRRTESGWSLGPATTYAQMVAAELPASLAGLQKSAHLVGSPQIRNTATVGGNICNSSPAADVVPPLMALDAMLTLQRKADGQIRQRQVALTEFFTGKGRNVLETGELLTDISFQAIPDSACLAFEKLGLREALAISRICLAVCAETDGGLLRNVRVASGSLGETGMREPEVEAVLSGQPLTPEVIAHAQEVLSDVCAARLASRSTMPFKREAIRGLLGHALATIAKGDRS